MKTPRYIDADKVLAEFPIRRNHYDEENGNIHFINGIETVMEYIDTVADEQPADVQEVKHSKWVEVDGDVFECFNCRRYRIHGCYIPKPRYCGNCGAKMDLEGVK